MSIEYQIAFGNESEWTSEKLFEKLDIVNPYLTSDVRAFTLAEIKEAYRFGLNKGFEVSNDYIYLGKVCERFFNQIHMHRAITLNFDKVKEALELISAFSTAGNNDEDWIKYRNKVIEEITHYI